MKKLQKSWAGKDGTYEHHPNTSMKGFSIVGSVSRISNDNKVFRIRDPRGFEVEISSSNLSDIILENTLINGEIQEELVWFRDGSSNYLGNVNMPEYAMSTQEPVTKSSIEVGAWYVRHDRKDTYYRYEGLFYRDSVSLYANNSTTNIKRYKKPEFVFTSFIATNGEIGRQYRYRDFVNTDWGCMENGFIETRSSISKNLVVAGKLPECLMTVCFEDCNKFELGKLYTNGDIYFADKKSREIFGHETDIVRLHNQYSENRDKSNWSYKHVPKTSYTISET